ncbi:hypothetical protein PQE73_gp043 [Bacillus phage vB_BanS_MrDarsey]|uniref:Uncharacterized protein n=1 Tax=Bacillus phage vB_BanS_MrDarsey TaxID=2894787 RepID=A0AAE8YQ60_9CAUD|nr:hypothetical protein PQE73_gp043 [Bacillus phage vB_BanS_MrDarsey]UGO47875.1 hypothetical protein MRDARSEY_43 [Bacillus phage vB_BanS_MrDarsey]
MFMRELKVVREKRNYLRMVFEKANRKRSDFIGGRELKGLSQYDWNVLAEMGKGMEKISAQIEALTFVLNEDSEISQAYENIGRKLTYDDLFDEDIYDVNNEDERGRCL